MKHVFIIALKLKNYAWKKIESYFCVQKNDAQVLGFAVAEKAHKVIEKRFFEKKFFPVYLCREDLQNGRGIKGKQEKLC